MLGRVHTLSSILLGKSTPEVRSNAHVPRQHLGRSASRIRTPKSPSFACVTAQATARTSLRRNGACWVTGGDWLASRSLKTAGAGLQAKAGGGGGNRTPVRRYFCRSVYARSPLFVSRPPRLQRTGCAGGQPLGSRPNRRGTRPEPAREIVALNSSCGPGTARTSLLYAARGNCSVAVICSRLFYEPAGPRRATPASSTPVEASRPHGRHLKGMRTPGQRQTRSLRRRQASVPVRSSLR